MPQLFTGKLAPKYHAKTLFFKNYYVAVPPPPTVSYYDLRLRSDSWGMFGNGPDTYQGQPFSGCGCCAGAAPYHQVELSTSYTQDVPTPTINDVIALYEAVGGYDPSQTQQDGSNPTDNGMALTDVWDYLMKKRLILGWVAIDWTNFAHVTAALNIFGGLQRGVQFPQSAMDQFNSGQNFDVVAHDGGIVGGHALFDTGYRPDPLFPTVTWARRVVKTPAWDLKYTDELYALIFKSWLSNKTQMSPSHLNFSALNNDLQALQQ